MSPEHDPYENHSPFFGERRSTLRERQSLWLRKDKPTREELDIEKKWLLFAQVNPEMFIFFYDKYFDRITSFVFHKLNDRDLTEELVSKTFFHALHNLNRFRWQGVTFGAWLFRIALNEIRSYVRNKTYWQQDSTRPIEDRPVPKRDQLEDLILSERIQLVQECLQELAEKDQDILIFFYWEHLSTPQIAAVLDLSENTAKVYLMRARRKLQKLLMARGYGTEGVPLESIPALRLVSGGEGAK